MTSIERTAYSRFTRAPSIKELQMLYTSTPTDIAFVATTVRGPAQKFGLMILRQPSTSDWGIFPSQKPSLGPLSVIFVPFSNLMLMYSDIASNHALYCYRAQIRKHPEIISDGKQIRHVAASAMRQAAQSMQSPADLISAAVEVLVKEQCELPAFSTLERLARRIRTLVHREIYRSIASRLTDSQAASLLRVLEADPPTGLTAFHRIKEVPKSATLTHLVEWIRLLAR
ncbi:DUF4158 domain-containing protein [Ktedonosporobacter rubrisoli]|uniref:DUF4158 domain-containing protein n=1 Tax=Ktedonosporobacter rubrisoli TaxID=2509675 RepID=A0A4P6K2N8_KTERU|nr:DUF4158 domain-containing protein [Ktedonosporobacter rubrisoli]QBD81970.1 DUF4158 domain-containing protein [Ktedonosporobacter rubrisoli]